MRIVVSVSTHVFFSIVGVVKHVDDPTHCTSAERCILAYVHDLYNACYCVRVSIDNSTHTHPPTHTHLYQREMR